MVRCVVKWMGFGTIVAILAQVAVLPASAYQIGHTERVFIDPERGNRQVPTEIYYPAAAPGEDVPVADPPADGFPVIAFGHGFLISVDDYDFVWEGLISNGYVVALPRTETGALPNHLNLGLDLAFVCAALQAEGDNPQSAFYGAIAATCAVSGHSMGGGASFLGAASDPAITALFNFAAAETNPSAISAAGQIAAPALLFAGSLDCVTPPGQHQLPMYNALASDCRTFVQVTGASHCQFAEYNFICGLGETGCPPPTISREEQHALTLSFLQPWLDRFLKNDFSAWNDFQTLLASHPGITYLQDCEAGGVDEPGIGPRPCLLLASNSVGTSRVVFNVVLPAAESFQLSIYDVSGRRVRTWVDQAPGMGAHLLEWNGLNASGRPVPTGCYFARLDSHPATVPIRVLMVW